MLKCILATATGLLFFGGTVSTAKAPPPTPIKAMQAVEYKLREAIPEPPIPAEAHHPEWWGLAREAGWTDDLLPTLDYVMWRESRCLTTAHNTTLNRDGSADLGLTQINDRSWCLPTRWYPQGYLQTIGILPTVGCEQLFDPYLNLLSAKAIHDYAQQTNGNGWQPWKL